MELMIVLRASTPPENSRDFGAKLDGNKLSISQPVHAVLSRHHLATAEQLVAYAFSDPGTLAQDLGWSTQDIERARAQLVGMLRGYVAEESLAPPVAPRRRFGALPPRR